ncbi:MAG TPA: SCP2 sterol-binding domain-containing protein [Gaiellaceae bacterium]
MSGELESFIAEIPARAAGKDLSGLRSTYAFVVENGKAWTIRFDSQEVVVSDGAVADADCTVSASEETFTRLLDGKLGVMSAYLTGKLKLSGDLGAAMQLSKLLS